jgi:uncharacterized protein (TIGR02246 family)
MGRTFVFVTIGFLAGLSINSLARSARTLQQPDTHAADLAAIEQLHKADIAATLKQDPGAEAILWSDDAVNLQFPGPAVVGTKAMQEAYEKFRSERPDFKVLKYEPNIKDIQVAGEWAIEWGYADATYQIGAKESPITMRVKILRVLKRQSDGSWKFARIASNN